MKRTLVTGASSGIGKAVAIELGARGHRIAGVGRDVGRLSATAEAVGPSFVSLALDLDVDGAADEVVRAASDQLGGLDGLVVAHGVAAHVPIAGLDAASIDLHLRTNLRTPLLLAAAFARHAARPATLVFVTSTLAQRPAATTTAYAASKAGLFAAAQALALELFPSGIRVATVSPGLIDTDMIRPLRLAPGEVMPTGAALLEREAEQRRALEALAPIGRLGAPAEIARGVAFLFESELAVGTNLVLDGGLTLR